jgi:hypothetical protein
VRDDTIVRTVFEYHGMQSVNVSAGRGDNGLEVFGILGTPAGVPVTLTDASTTSQVEFFAGPPLDFIRGPLTIHGRAANLDVLLVDDADNPNPQTYTVTANTVSRMGMAQITYDNLIQMSLYTSNTGALATVNVQSTPAGAFTEIQLLTGGDQATVNAPSVQGSLDIHSYGAVPVAVAVDDSSDGTPRTATFSTDPTYRYLLNGLAPGQIFLNVDPGSSMQIKGGSGGNTFNVQSGLSGTALTLTGGSGSNTLVGSNAGNSWEVTGADTGVLSGSAYPSPVSFIQVGNLTAGSGGDYFLVDDQATLSGNLTGGGSDTLDYSPYSTSVLVDLQTGVATGVGGSVSGITTVLGGNGNGTQAFNLLIGNGGDTLIGGFGRSNILVAGGSASTLTGGDSNDLLIGGTTVYDTDPALTAWQQIAAYWAGTDGNTDDYATRVANLMSGNGVPLLDASTVTGNGGGNTMTGNGALALIYSDGNNDNITGFDPNSIVVPITP